MRLASAGLGLALFILGGCATSRVSVTPAPDGPQDVQPVERVSVAPGRGNLSPYVVFGETYRVEPSSLGYLEIGLASWYGRKFHGRLTSNGEVFDMHQLSAAHKSLPLPTVVRVTNLDNGKDVVLRVNDRGPFHDDRLIDLSWQAAKELGFADKGVAPVVIEALDEINYPEMIAGPVEHESFYLQVGAFSRPEGAETQQQRIENLISVTEFADVDVRILQSELENSTLLHKVWLGPIASEEARDRLAVVVEQADLGLPLKVSVD